MKLFGQRDIRKDRRSDSYIAWVSNTVVTPSAVAGLGAALWISRLYIYRLYISYIYIYRESSIFFICVLCFVVSALPG